MKTLNLLIIGMLIGSLATVAIFKMVYVYVPPAPIEIFVSRDGSGSLSREAVYGVNEDLHSHRPRAFVYFVSNNTYEIVIFPESNKAISASERDELVKFIKGKFQ